MSLRRVRAVIRGLPRGSALSRKLDPHQWGPGDYLAAVAIDALQIGNWQRQGDTKAEKPKPIMRPADIAAQARKTQEIGRRARALRERQRKRRESGANRG